jgi:transposase
MGAAMMGTRQVPLGALFYAFSVEDHVPQGHILRSFDRVVDLTGVRQHLVPYYSSTDRPSINPELIIRMRLFGCIMGIRSKHRLCERVHLDLASC